MNFVDALLKTQLPKGWEWKTMADISDVVGGGTPKTADTSNFEIGGIPWVTPADLSGYTKKNLSGGSRSLSEKGLQSCGARLLPVGTVLFTSRAPIGYVAVAENPIATNQGFKSFVLDGSVLPDYVYWWLKGAKQLAESLASGTTFLEISGANAKKLPIPIAPLNEQHHVVAEIEKQFSRLDKAVSNLERVKANLKRYKASVLKDAVEGRLVPAEYELARREGRSFDLAEQLLKRLLEIRRDNWSGKRGYREPVTPDSVELLELPLGWVWASTEQLSAGEPYSLAIGPFGSDLKVADYRAEGVPLIFVRNIRAVSFGGSDTVFVTPEKAEELKSHQVKAGDILVTKMGAPPGDVCMYPANRPMAVITADCIKWRLMPDQICPSFFAYAIESEVVQSQILAITKGVAQLKISLGGFSSIAIPLPPLAEQNRIVAEVDRRLSLVRKMEKEVSIGLKRAHALRKSVLQSAFSGDIKKLEFLDPSIPVSSLSFDAKPMKESMSVVMAARLMAVNCSEPTFGRVKLQKMMYIATHHGKIATNDKYSRQQAGPLDMPMLERVIKRVDDLQWFRETKRPDKAGYSYSGLTRAEEYKRHLEALTADQLKVIDGLSKLMRKWSTEDCELFATVYAAWNDLILQRYEPSAEAVIHEIRENWHESKKKFSTTEIKKMMERIAALGYQPTGFGRPTKGEAADTISGELFESHQD